MKTLLFIFLLISSFAFAQGGAIADLKFEEAETAFNNGNYNLTLKKVDEFEKALGNMTSKSLYLRILAQDKLFAPENFYADENQLTKYNELTANVNKYLSAMESEGLDDKYREIYTLGGRLNDLNLPKDKAGWEMGNKALEDQKQLAEEKAKKKLKYAQDFMLLLAQKMDFKPNMTLSEYAGLSAQSKEMADKKVKSSFNGIVREKTIHQTQAPFYLKTEKNASGEEIVTELRYCISGDLREKYNDDVKRSFEDKLNVMIQNLGNDQYVKRTTCEQCVPPYKDELEIVVPGLEFSAAFRYTADDDIEMWFEMIRKK
ncbi:MULTISPECIES: hypothetical protein [Flavobacterium]|uniref:hypothetical protein n=1 Tax=Flavobacterium TaxID=237 RepID=UPI001FCBDF57|nr:MULTISPECIES: hypothetical protein [Flavobacterium]UOK43906.1 hypothetical protein LZF87_07240 [Flavobacterium enshiense]